MTEKNPYLDENGRVIPEKATEAMEWARKAEEERRAKLPKEEQEKLRASDRHLDRKMNS